MTISGRTYTLIGLALLLVCFVLESMGWLLPGLSEKFQMAVFGFVSGLGVAKGGLAGS